MTKLPISLACGAYDRTEAIHTGAVTIDGCDVNAHALTPEESFFRSFGHAEFDVSELSFSTYLMRTARGDCPYIAIPAFVSRSFRHSAIYVRADGPVKTAEDLKGRRVGVPEYQVTAAVWVRQMLEADHGVAPGDVQWLTGGVEEAGRTEKTPLALPPAISVTQIAEGKTLNRMLLDGEIDALVCPRAPSSYTGGTAPVRRLFDDPAGAARDYLGRHGIFPIMHVIGIRKTLVADHPWLPGSVFKSFRRARDLAMERLRDTTALAISLPWLIEETERTAEIFGGDFWRYGVGDDPAVGALLDTHHRQGLSDRRLDLTEVFAPGSMESFRI